MRLERSLPGSALSPAIVVAWLWAGLVILILLYTGGAVGAELAEPLRGERLSEVWWEGGAAGLPLRYLIKVVNVLLLVLLWLAFRSSRRRRGTRRMLEPVLYTGTALLLLAVEWACHVFGQTLPRWGVERLAP